MRRLAYLLLLTSVLGAQNGSLEGPSLGVLWHAGTRTLRPMLGIFGAARLGEPFAAGRVIQTAEVCPYSRCAIALAGEGDQAQATVATWTNGSVDFLPLTGLPSGFGRVVFSPSGKAAGTSVGSSFFRIVGLPAQASVSEGPVQASSRLLAVSDSGTLLLAATEGEVTVLYRAAASGVERLASAADVRAASFEADSENAFVLAGDQILTFAGSTAGVSIGATANAAALAVVPPAVVALVPGGVLLLSRGASNPPERVDCDCDPTFLQPLREGVFQLTRSSAELVWILDVNARAVRFVPALPQGEEAPR